MAAARSKRHEKAKSNVSVFKHEIELGSIWVGKSKGFRGKGPEGIAVIGGTVAWFVRHTLRKGSHM